MSTTLHSAEALHCPPSERIPWIPDGGIDVGNYTSPNDQCCDVNDPGTAFDAKGNRAGAQDGYSCEEGQKV